MSDHREPLGLLPPNTPFPRAPRRLAPIFDKPLKAPIHSLPVQYPFSSSTSHHIPTSSPDTSIQTPADDDDAGPSRKRVRQSSSPFPPDEMDSRHHVRMPSMHDLFAPTPPWRCDIYDYEKIREVVGARAREENKGVEKVWRRGRRRLGVDGVVRADTVESMSKHRCET